MFFILASHNITEPKEYELIISVESLKKAKKKIAEECGFGEGAVEYIIAKQVCVAKPVAEFTEEK